MFPKYEKGILQVSNAVRGYYGLKSYYEADTTIKQWLENGKFKRVYVILIDGMGSRVLNKLSPDGFFRKHMVKETETVYPPTTVAATTSLRTGLAPSQTGWVGWSQYFKEKNDEILPFFGSSIYDKTPYGIDYCYKEMPVSFVTEELNAKGIKATDVWPSWGRSHPCEDYSDQLKCLLHLQNDPDLRFAYCYWDAFDSLMHEYGPSSIEAKRELLRLEDLTQSFDALKQEDTGVLILADHGQVDVENVDISKDEELCKCLAGRPWLEARATSFRILPDMKETFEIVFNKHYGSWFELLSHDEIMKRNIFGPVIGENRFEEFIGDYIAFAKEKYCLGYGIGLNNKGQHAGTLEDEMFIPIILL